MKWRQGLAVITRTEHWELASQHLWGLSRSEIAAYLLLEPTEPAQQRQEAIRTQTAFPRAFRAAQRS